MRLKFHTDLSKVNACSWWLRSHNAWIHQSFSPELVMVLIRMAFVFTLISLVSPERIGFHLDTFGTSSEYSRFLTEVVRMQRKPSALLLVQPQKYLKDNTVASSMPLYKAFIMIFFHGLLLASVLVWKKSGA